MTTSWSRGIVTSMFLRLCSRAPLDDDGVERHRFGLLGVVSDVGGQGTRYGRAVAARARRVILARVFVASMGY